MNSKETISILCSDYRHASAIPPKLTDYLKRTEAIPVDTPYGLIEFHFPYVKRGEIDTGTSWTYQLNNTTLIIQTRHVNDNTGIAFIIAGKYAKTISADLQSILDQCK